VSDAARPPVLSGLRIVEISAFGGATLAALGADVIRIDPPGGGIDIGRWPLYQGHSLYWAGLNQGKRSVTIDTHTEDGRRQVAKLITAPGEGGGILGNASSFRSRARPCAYWRDVRRCFEQRRPSTRRSCSVKLVHELAPCLVLEATGGPFQL
jgi:hypothetical protein